MANVSIDFQGLDALKFMLKTSPKDVLPLAEQALYEEAQVIFARSQQLVPVRTGVLRASGMVSNPKRMADSTYVELSYGGPAANYAMWVHESYSRHIPPTQRKYLQRPVEERMPMIATNIARRMEDMLRRALAAGGAK